MRQGWAIKSCANHAHTYHKVLKNIYTKKTESSESLTRYVSPGYGGHVVMEGYNEIMMGNKELY